MSTSDDLYLWEKSLLFSKERKRGFVAEKFLDGRYLRGEGYTKEEAIENLKEFSLQEKSAIGDDG